MAKKAAPWIKGFLTAYAMRMTIDYPLKRSYYAETSDYLTDSVYSLLGNYDFIFLFFWILAAVFFIFLAQKESKKDAGLYVLSLVFSLLLPIGEVLEATGTVGTLFGSFVNVVKTILIVVGFFFFFSEGLGALTPVLQKKNILTEGENFFTRRAFLKCFLILEAVYLIAVLCNFPGNLCYDTEGQMMQVLGESAWSAHHPLVVTLIMGLPVKLGLALTGSKAFGIFLYMVLQITMLAAALSFTIRKLAGRQVSPVWLWVLTGIYAFTPVYSNIASTAIKDVPFISAFLVYFVLLLEFSLEPEKRKNRKFLIGFVIFQTLTCLLRKNGFYVVGFAGFIWSLTLIRREGWKEFIKNCLKTFVISVLAAWLVNTALASMLHAEKGSAGEAFSLPFQITARYINTYSDELTEKEISAISGVLGDDMIAIADRYNPLLADGVKALYNKDAGIKELTAYLGVWVEMFFKHPGVYIDGFLVHTYGWYCPNVTTAWRYETEEDDFYAPAGIFAVMDKVMIFVYRFADRISLLGVMQNAGFAVWAFWYLTYLQKNKDLCRAGIPLWVSFFVCLIAPGFMQHTRYAFPILMGMPYFFIFSLSQNKQETDHERT